MIQRGHIAGEVSKLNSLDLARDGGVQRGMRRNALDSMEAVQVLVQGDLED
jgi:hypothetical protein